MNSYKITIDLCKWAALILVCVLAAFDLVSWWLAAVFVLHELELTMSFHIKRKEDKDV